MRSISFADANEVYSYPSPDIEYFQSRHLIYVLIAIYGIGSNDWIASVTTIRAIHQF